MKEQNGQKDLNAIFYEFIDELKKWWKTLQPKPTTIEEAEGLPEIQKWIKGPTTMNFRNRAGELLIKTFSEDEEVRIRVHDIKVSGILQKYEGH